MEQVVPWLQAMKEAFLKAKNSLPKKHLLGQTVQNHSPDLSNEAWCAWLPTEYVRPAGLAIGKNYGANKPLVDVESDYFGYGLMKPYTDRYDLAGMERFTGFNGVPADFCLWHITSGGRVKNLLFVPAARATSRSSRFVKAASRRFAVGLFSE